MDPTRSEPDQRAWKKAGPWLTPALVVVEVVLVWSGLLRLRTAIVVGVALEVALWVTALSRTIAGVRRFRASRAAGLDGWRAAEDALAQLVPRPLAKVILFEPRLWVCLSHWVLLRDGFLTGLEIPYAAIVGVRAARRPNFGRSGLKVDAEQRSAILAHGDANVAIALDPARPLQVNGRPCPTPLAELAITVDRATEFVKAARTRLAFSAAS